MEETPNFKMQCPKCGKDFPFDAIHCEECSAMLEPVETPGSSAAASEETIIAPAGRAPNEGARPVKPPKHAESVSEEKIEDIRIDTLKADIENQFLFTLLLELEQLKKRLSRKEKQQSELHEKQQTMAYPDYVAATGRSEKEIEELITRTTKLELIIENLQKNIASDIRRLEGTLKGLAKPPLSARYTDAGRYYRMISSELRIKTVLMGIIDGTIPRSYFRTKRMLRMLGLGAAGAVAVALLLYFMPSLSVEQPVKTEVSSPAPQAPAAVRPKISEQDIRNLLDDIKTANMTKNLALWESRYAVSYLKLKDKRESIQEQWKKFDYLSLAYRIENLNLREDSANALIVWDIELKPVGGSAVSRVSSRLASTFVSENSMLRISSVTKEDR